MNYRKLRDKNNRQSTMAGIVLAVALHAGLALTLLGSGLTYLDPPPPEESFLIDFRDHQLVQRSEAQHVGKKANKAPEATVGDKGDVEVKEPPREKPIDKRALFSAANNKAEKDTLAPQTASSVSDKLKAGHPKGNTTYGKVDGEPNGVKGRSVVNGNIPVPNYPVQESGVVVVAVKVNQYGKVVEAKPGAPGTTTSNSTLWAEARKAAMKTVFNQAADAPVLQDGTITYKFNLK